MSAALLTPEEVAERLHLTLNTVYVWLRDGRLPGIRLGHRWRIDPDELAGFLRARTHDTQAALPHRERTSPAPEVPIWQRFLDLAAQLPDDVVARLPEDGADQHDHYIYGVPKHGAGE